MLTNIIQPGRFTPIYGGALTFHLRERRPNGELIGIFIDDRRDPNERATFLAERGQTVENESGTFLVLEHGSVQRHGGQAARSDDRTVRALRVRHDAVHRVGERRPSTRPNAIWWDLIQPDLEDPYVRPIRAASAPNFTIG